MIELLLSLGGNEGDKRGNFKLAEKLLEVEVGEIICSSSIYETEPWGFEAENLFWNQVLMLKTDLTAHEVLSIILDIEARMGRMRVGEGYSSRPMDIDILFYGDNVINDSDLVVPHPLLNERNFVLAPLEEICPEKVHPVLRKSISELKMNCKDVGEIHKIS